MYIYIYIHIYIYTYTHIPHTFKYNICSLLRGEICL